MALSPEGAATIMQFLERVPTTGTQEAAALLRCLAELKTCIPQQQPPGKTPPPAPPPKKKAARKKR